MTEKKKTSKKTQARRNKPPEGKKLALLCVEAALDKKAEEPVILDIRKLTSVADYFVICHGTSTRQVQAIAENIMEKLAKAGVKLLGEEGMPECKWVLLDATDVVVHIFDEPVRRFYDLEKLWIHAKEIKLPAKLKKGIP